MANGNRVFADRFRAQTGANFLSALASIERMHREERQQDNAFRQALILQDRRLDAQADLQAERLSAQERMATERTTHELGLQQLESLRNLSKELNARVNASKEQLKGLAYTSESLQRLPYYNKTNDGISIMTSLENDMNEYQKALGEGDLGINDLINVTSKYNEILETRLDIANRNVSLAQEIDTFLDTQAPEWFREYKDKNPSASLDSAIRQKANLTVDSGEFEQLKVHCDKFGIEFLSTPFDLESAKFLSDLMPVFKISSSDITKK